MDYLSVQALAGTAVSRIEGSLGEIPQGKEFTESKTNCLLPTCD